MKITQTKHCQEITMSKNEIKIGTKREELFTRVKKVSEQKIKECKEELEVQKEILSTAEKIIAEEK